MKYHIARILGFYLVFTVVMLMVFWSGFTTRFTLGGQAAELILPTLSHLRGTLLQGEWPFWNPYQLQGLDTTVFPVYWNALYVMTALLFPQPATAVNALYLTLLFIGGAGFYKFSTLFVNQDKTAMLGGICFPLIGIFVGLGSHLGIVAVAALAPGLLYAHHRYLTSKKSAWILLTGLGYFLLSTLTSAGFVLCVSIALVVQNIITTNPDHRWGGMARLMGMMGLAGMLLWKILMERSQAGMFTPVSADIGRRPVDALYDLHSFVLPRVQTVTGGHNAAFPHYLGILLLVFALVGWFVQRTGTDRRLGWIAILGLVLAIIGGVWETTAPGYSGMTGPAMATSAHFSATTAILVLGLRGLEKCLATPGTVRYIFLILSLIGAAAAMYLPQITPFSDGPNLLKWVLELEIWKLAFLCISAAIAMWMRNINVRWTLVALLILTDLGIANYLNQDAQLWHDHPRSEWGAMIQSPEKKETGVDLSTSVGKFMDEDLAVGGLDRNTGTLLRTVVRDGHWPWTPGDMQDGTTNPAGDPFRYPILYFSRDTSGNALPTLADFDSDIRLLTHHDSRWDLEIDHRYEKFLIFNQNFHPQWTATINSERIPIRATDTGTMMISIPPGKQSIQFLFRPDGTHHLFIFMMIACFGLLCYLILKNEFPVLVAGTGIPIILLLGLGLGDRQKRSPSPATSPQDSRPEYSLSYETLPPQWFLRGAQLNSTDSRSGYRSERLDSTAQYGATLQLGSSDLDPNGTLSYRFHVKSPKSVRLAVVFKIDGPEGESHNIDYVRSLDNRNWTVLEGQFSIPQVHNPQRKAEWYIWNYEHEDFLIDDIEIKLSP